MDAACFLDTCRTLAPVLAEHAADGEARRRLPVAVADALHDSGILRAVVPPSLGGLGLDLRTLCEGTRELGRGCPASAWTASFFMLHGWLLSKFPVESHGDLFGGGRLPTAAAPLTPSGRLEGAPGGYRVRGRWEWSTGIMDADWCIVHGFDATVETGTRFAVLPVADLEIEDTWHTSGMRATGSNVVVVDDVFVPAERTCDGATLRERQSGLADDRLGELPLLSVLALVASAPAVGGAEAALDAYRDRLADRVLAYSAGDKAVDQPLTQARLASVSSEVATMLAGWRHAIDRFAAWPTHRSDLLRVESRLAAAAAVRQARLTIGTVGEGAGASVYSSAHPIQRLQRDVEIIKGHVVFDWDRTTELAGRVMVGLPLRPTDMA